MDTQDPAVALVESPIFEEYNAVYNYFPVVVTLTIITTSALLVPSYVMYTKKLYFESITLIMFLLIELSNVLHRETARVLHSNTDYFEQVREYMYIGLTVSDWFILSTIFMMFVTAQCGMLMCANQKREHDEAGWGVFLVLIVPVSLGADGTYTMLSVDWVIWSFILAGVALVVIPVASRIRRRKSVTKQMNLGTYIKLFALWIPVVFLMVLHQSVFNPYRLFGIFQIIHYSCVPLFSVVIFWTVDSCKIEEREWFIKKYAMLKDEVETHLPSLPRDNQRTANDLNPAVIGRTRNNDVSIEDA